MMFNTKTFALLFLSSAALSSAAPLLSAREAEALAIAEPYEADYGVYAREAEPEYYEDDYGVYAREAEPEYFEEDYGVYAREAEPEAEAANGYTVFKNGKQVDLNAPKKENFGGAGHSLKHDKLHQAAHKVKETAKKVGTKVKEHMKAHGVQHAHLAINIANGRIPKV